MIPDIEFYEPENVFKNLSKNKEYYKIDGKPFEYVNCPSFRDLLNNTYSIKFPIDYNLTYSYNEDKIFLNSDRYNQEFFDKYIHVRSIENKLITIKLQYLFFSEESLEIMLSSCHFHENDFTKSIRVVPGKYNIGKWIRPIEIAIINNKKNNSVIMKKGDEGCYVTFLTEENVNLIKFNFNEKIRHFIKGNLISKRYNKITNSLEKWYEKFELSKQKNYILKEIKNNLME
jgi:hypothetical protein